MSDWPEEDPFTASWQCKLPVRVCLNPNSISSPTALPPFYVLASRQSYVSSISSQTWPMVQHVLPKLPGNVQPKPWFDYQGMPLKSTLTVGVLFDLLSPDASGAAAGEALSALPWHLTMHYTHAPAEVSASWLTSLPPQTHYMNSLKEACHICKGADGSAAVMRLDGAVQDALWAAVEKCDVQQYRSHLSSLKVVPSPKPRSSAPANLPIRLLLRRPAPPPPATSGAGDSTPGSHNVWDSIVCTSRPIPAQHPAGRWVSLGEALHALLPIMFPTPPPPPAEDEAQADDSNTPAEAASTQMSADTQGDTAVGQGDGGTGGEGVQAAAGEDAGSQAATAGETTNGSEASGPQPDGGTGGEGVEEGSEVSQGAGSAAAGDSSQIDTGGGGGGVKQQGPQQLTLPLNVNQAAAAAAAASVMVDPQRGVGVAGGGACDGGKSRCKWLVGGCSRPWTHLLPGCTLRCMHLTTSCT